ncbi:hypothetical protein LOD99_7580 [Oopsacas minuta]|uniref:RING-type domain-containing protein n=1 Tax=Oopsacas minuta TaxID=111878 RepID=A0AAV7JPY3_9METZ|nr:hypothetical protein LOD99_7580 [Oopsacas minuta]
MATRPEPQPNSILEEDHDLKSEQTEYSKMPDVVVEGDKGGPKLEKGDDSIQVSNKMNDKVKFEVVGLFKQGIVSQALGVNNFREKLESTLKDACEMQAESNSSNKKKPKTKPRVRSRARDEEDSITENSRENRVTRRSSPRQNRRISSNRASPTPRRPAFASTPHRHRPRTGYRRNTVTSSLPEEIGNRLSRYNLSEHQRETIVADLQNMVSNQVVSTTLAGEFRGTLELHLRQRAGRIEDGMAPDEIIEEVQRQAGTETERPRQSSEVGSFTATGTLPVGGGNSQAIRDLTRQIEDMKQQMTEMQRMMRVTFEVSQYTQRSIRQEVSAAMNAWTTPGCNGPQVAPVIVTVPHTAPNVTSSGEPNPDTVIPAAYGVCVVCTQNKIDSVVYRCGHMCVCQPCGYELIAGNHKCPMCRSPITDIVRVYKSSA